MEIINTAKDMQGISDAFRQAGKIISLVPTMGFLHEGHIELLRIAKKHSDELIMSLFVNPTQFGPNEDFEDYPRDIEGDLSKARETGVDIVFHPSAEEIYPEGYQTTVRVDKVTKHLCGLSRPTHFDGVTTVVAKLFNITKPHLAVFGQKDYQQLVVISRMVIDLNMDIEIIGAPTVREADGLAMSSRNSYLKGEERESALCLKKSLDLAEEMLHSGERDAKTIINAVKDFINKHPSTEIDYVNLCDPTTLEDIGSLGDESLLALAVRVGKTRLIDNRVLK
jgi:pantoate--beta-alanine ligase